MLKNKNLWGKIPKFLQEPDPEIYLRGNYVVVDFETTNLDKGSPHNRDNSILQAAWEVWEGGRRVQSYLERADEYHLSKLVRHVERSDFIVAHNAAFELGWLERCGVDIAFVLPFCTQVAEWVIAGNRPWGRYQSLERALQRYGLEGKEHGISKIIRAGINPDDISPRLLGKYCAKDVRQTGLLFRHQIEELFRLFLLAVTFTRNIFIPPKVDMESRGMYLDERRTILVYEYLLSERKQLEIEFERLTGGFNFRSTQQREDFIYGELNFHVPKGGLSPTGRRKTDGPTLKRLQPKTKRQRAFINVLKLLTKNEALFTKSVEKFKRCIDETDDHILTASINQTSTGTHRLSSSGRNYKTQFQNFDRKLKPIFRARYPGWRIAEIDESGLEFRVAAELAGCQTALEFIKLQNDPHEFSGRIIFEGQWDPEQPAKSPRNSSLRQDAKEHTFKPLYGGQSGTQNEQLYYRAFREKFSGIATAQDRWKDEVLKTGKLRTATGLIFYWPDTRITSSGYITNSTNICNYPVQMFATADIVPIAVTYQWHFMRAAKMSSFLVNTIHDSSIGEVHPDEGELYEELAVKAFIDVPKWYVDKVYNIKLVLDLEAEYKIDEYWGNTPDWEEQWKVS